MDHKYPERYPSGLNLTFVYVREVYGANYTCLVTYTESGRDFSLTRTLQVKVVGKEGPGGGRDDGSCQKGAPCGWLPGGAGILWIPQCHCGKVLECWLEARVARLPGRVPAVGPQGCWMCCLPASRFQALVLAFSRGPLRALEEGQWRTAASGLGFSRGTLRQVASIQNASPAFLSKCSRSLAVG